MTVAEFILERLKVWGVHRIFGYPGDGINGLISAFEHVKDPPRLIQVRHEEAASFMACAHAKMTAELGVCLATSGPGAIHLLNGLYDAKADHMPVLAIVGQSSRVAIGSSYQQEVDLAALFKDVAHEFCIQASAPAQIRHLVDRAIRTALAERAVTCLIVPNDLQLMEAVETPPHAPMMSHSGAGYSAPTILPAERDLKGAAEILNAGERVAMLVGAGALGAAEEVEQVADHLGAGVAKALLGKAALPDDLPYVTGCIGLLGTKASDELMRHCDTLLMVGTAFPYSEFLPKEGQSRCVQIDIDARSLSLRYPADVALVGDTKATLTALLPLLESKTDRGFRESIAGWNAEWWKLLDARAHVKAEPLNPQLVFWDLSPLLPDGAILIADSGTSASWFARDLKIRRGMRATLSGGLASMGNALPYAISAKFAHPDRPVFALVGDGAMQMNGINELLTLGKYWREWRDPRFVVLVLNNRDLNMVTWELRAESGNPRYEASQSIPDFPYAAYAELLGLRGLRMERPEDVAHMWAEALAATGPVVVEAVVDPNVPPLPPHITLEQAKHFAHALFAEAGKGSLIKQVIKGALAR